MNLFLQKAQELEDELIENRRYLHENAESGESLPMTTMFVKNQLKKIGLEPKEICDSGIVALIKGDHPGKTILLRADMDALPMNEENNLAFKSKTNSAHNCGHDFHTAMLLGAAKILSKNKDKIYGTIKLMFQPAEELFVGSSKMIKSGVLENPSVDAAIGVHVALDTAAPSISYGTENTSASCDSFEIVIHGNGCHGAMPNYGIDPINVGVHIYLAFQNLIAREIDPNERVTLTFGQFCAGSTTNIIPNEAILKGTLRTFNMHVRTKIVNRMQEICQYIGKSFSANVEYITLVKVPTVYTDPGLMKEMSSYIKDLAPDFIYNSDSKTTASDDIAFISQKVPTAHFLLECKINGCEVQHHNPKVLFDESILPYGAAVYSTCAVEWLKNNK